MTDRKGELTFRELNAAWWKWVDENCPSHSSRARSKWISENTFTYDGTTWTRERTYYQSNSGKTVVARRIVFRSADNRTIERGPEEPNRRNDERRNWGLGRE